MAKSQGDHTANTFRFMPGRKEAAQDGRMLFSGIRYSRKAIVDASKGFLAGVAIGPGQHLPKDTEGAGFKLSPGGVIVPAYPNEKLETVTVRDFTPKDDKTGRPKQYVDWATFQKTGHELFPYRVIPFSEERVVYGEMWTGDYEESEGAYQLIQADVFAHGSVAFAGGAGMIVIDASHKKKAKTQKPGLEEEGVRASAAEVVGETRGTVIAGIPLWIARLFRIHYSVKDSEAVLVRQLDKYYLVLVQMKGDDMEIVPREVPASKYAKHFERLTIDQKLVPVESAAA
jgi:hypothetical protein